VTVQRTWTELPGALAAGQNAIWNSFWYAGGAAIISIVLGLLAIAWRQTRNPKPEIRKNSEGRKPNVQRAELGEICGVEPQASTGCGFGLRFSAFFRVSDFGFRIFQASAWLPFLLPGVLLGIGLIHAFNHGWSAWFYQTAGVVILALVIRYFVIGWYTAGQAIARVDPNLTDVALLEGATRWQMLRYVEWPQIARPVLVAWYIIFVLCLWDVESIILIIPPGGETLALRIFNLLHYGHNAQVNALCLTLLLLALVPLLVGSSAEFARAQTFAAAERARPRAQQYTTAGSAEKA
jgi:ABC-type Fe3+ transport system permease subunit